MSYIDNPPTYYFSTINFNPAFYGTSSNTLSQSQADKLYLKFPVSQTQLETISSDLTILGNAQINGTITVPSTGVINNGQYLNFRTLGSDSYISNITTNTNLNIQTFGTGNINLQGPVSTTNNLVINAPNTALALNGLDIETGSFFGRNDVVSNTFYGTLGFSRHPIGWTISASKAVSSFTNNITFDVIKTGTATTVFTALTNGVWRFGCTCNNAAILGSMTYVVLSYGTITGGTCVNGTTGATATSLFHQTTAGLSNMGLSYPEIIINYTGNKTTDLQINFMASFTVQPTITFNIWATKIA